MPKLTNLHLCLILFAATSSFAQRAIDPQKSTLTVHVLKSGMFSAFGHEHEISAPIEKGSFNEQHPAVELSVDARKLRVMDKDVSDKDRAEIQKTMLGSEVLDSEKYPEIRFASIEVTGPGRDEWTVRGNLTLHGQTQPVTVKIKKTEGHYRGSAEVKQRNFGISPVSVAGGAVKVKNEVQVEFDIVAAP